MIIISASPILAFGQNEMVYFKIYGTHMNCTGFHSSTDKTLKPEWPYLHNKKIDWGHSIVILK